MHLDNALRERDEALEEAAALKREIHALKVELEKRHQDWEPVRELAEKARLRLSKKTPKHDKVIDELFKKWKELEEVGKKRLYRRTRFADALAKEYAWQDNSLHEKRGDDESILQVSSADYLKVVAAIEDCLRNKKPIKVPVIRNQMVHGRTEAVPSTQLYLCIRYLKAMNLIKKSRAGTYECVVPERRFVKECENLMPGINSDRAPSLAQKHLPRGRRN
mgnify:CR=1 FL=1